jgi:nucleoside 2-deoxyribosyltransferase
MKFYLAGPVGYGSPGREWKNGIKNSLINSWHEVWDPIENDANYPRVNEMNKMKENPRVYFKEIREIMQEIFFDDCKFIEECDYLICYFVNRSYGTISEQGIAHYLSKMAGRRVKTICIFHETFIPDEWTLCCSDYVFFSLSEAEKFIMEEFCL